MHIPGFSESALALLCFWQRKLASVVFEQRMTWKPVLVIDRKAGAVAGWTPIPVVKKDGPASSTDRAPSSPGRASPALLCLRSTGSGSSDICSTGCCCRPPGSQQLTAGCILSACEKYQQPAGHRSIRHLHPFTSPFAAAASRTPDCARLGFFI